MEYVALTSISPSIIRELMNYRIRSMELRSDNNMFSMMVINTGDCVFITDRSIHDLVPGSRGVIARVRSKESTFHRSLHYVDGITEERETFSIRAQFEFVGLARVRRIIRNEFGSPVIVDAEPLPYYEEAH